MWLRREFDVPDFYGMRRIWTAAQWLPDGRMWVDPYKDAAAIEKSLAADIANTPDELAKQGIDWEEHLRAQAEFDKRKQEIREEFGLSSAPPPPPIVAAESDDEELLEDESEDEPDESDEGDEPEEEDADAELVGAGGDA
jgi:capsid protein